MTEKRSVTDARLDEIERRLDAIERRRSRDATDVPERMRELERKLADVIDGRDAPSKIGIDGMIEYAVYLKSEDGITGSEETTNLDDILALGTERLAASLNGLAHPVRVALFRALMTGPKESADLLKASSLNTTGQLYHHLAVMENAGLVDRRTRNLWSAQNLIAGSLFLTGAHLLAQWRGEAPG